MFLSSRIASVVGGALLLPFSVGYCKGWKRSVMCLTSLQAIRVLGLESEIPHRVKALWATGVCC